MTVHHTFVLRRRYRFPPERVFRAFSDPEQKRRWFTAGSSHTVEECVLDFREGGMERVVSRFGEGSPFPGVLMIHDGVHVDIVKDRRVVISSTMTIGERRISASLCTFELAPEEPGAELTLTHQGAFFEGADGPAMREEGWGKILDRLGEGLESA